MPTLEGSVENIVFRNEDNHYTVARFRPKDSGRLFRDDLMTIVGMFQVSTSANSSRLRVNGRRTPGMVVSCMSPTSLSAYLLRQKVSYAILVLA